MVTFLLRRFGALLLLLTCATSTSASALDTAIIVTDGTSSRDFLALRAEAMFRDAGYGKVHRVRMPTPAKINELVTKAMTPAARNVTFMLLADVSSSTAGPKLTYPYAPISSSFLRSELDRLTPAITGRQIVLLDGARASEFLVGLANPQYFDSQRVLLGSTNAPRDNSDRSNGYASLLMRLEFERPAARVLFELHYDATDRVRLYQYFQSTSPPGWADANGDGRSDPGDFWWLRRAYLLDYSSPIPDGSNAADRALIVDQSGASPAPWGSSWIHALRDLSLDDSAVQWMGRANYTWALGRLPSGEPTLAGVRQALGGFGGVRNVLLTFVAYGSDDFITLNAVPERLDYSELAAHMTAIQSQISGRLIVVVDTGYSGLIARFAAHVAAAPPGAFPRGFPIIVTSSGPTEYAGPYFTAPLLERLALGRTIADAAAYTDRFQAAMPYGFEPRTMIDADGDGHMNEPEDLLAAGRSLFQ